MKITFVCSSADPGGCGVGDYTRRLAGELIRSGHEVSAIAINDREQNRRIIEHHIEYQEDGGTQVPVVRLSGKASWKDRENFLDYILRKEDPDLVSLQYVPHGFHPKGIPFHMISMLSKLPDSLRWHVMLHELWTSFQAPLRIKSSVASLAQRYALRSLLNRLNPVLVTTSNYRYRERLPSHDVEVLPLFSNIDSQCSNVQPVNLDRSRFHCVFFGSFALELKGFEKQLRFIKALALRHGRPPMLHLIGRRPHETPHVQFARRCFGDEFVVDHGPFSRSQVSSYLLGMDFGISRADKALFAKSGSTYAMLEHGLPVLLRGENGSTRDLSESIYREQVHFCDNQLSALPEREKPRSGVSEVAMRFTSLVKYAANRN